MEVLCMRQPFPNYRWVSRVDIDTINFLEQFCVRGEDEIRLTLQEAPTRETRSDNNTGTPCPTLSENRVGFFLTSPVNHVEPKLQETEPGKLQSAITVKLRYLELSSSQRNQKKSSWSRCLTVNDWKMGSWRYQTSRYLNVLSQVNRWNFIKRVKLVTSQELSMIERSFRSTRLYFAFLWISSWL